jgi:quinoprotein glucose dehydrogenase
VARQFPVAWCAGLLLCVLVSSGSGQQGAARGDWPTYGADLANTRYSALDQINASNFNSLQIAWRFKTDNLGPRPEYQFEGTPLEIGAVLYSTAGSRRAVIALDAATGELLWMHSEQEGKRGDVSPRKISGRGLAYWSDGKEQRILYFTPGYRLIALDAKTGAPVSTFGTNGAVDLKVEDDQDIDPMSGEIGLQSAPVVAGDVVIVGASHRSGAVPKSKINVKGFVRGFDVRTGRRLWIFHTIPLAGEYGNDTWLNDSWKYTGNAGVWTQISVDESLGLAYLPVEMPTGDYYGGDRPGSGLFGESLVAVDLHTGLRRWHYQLVHHGLWDLDIPAPPMLINMVVNGRARKAVAQPTKQSFLYVFDRATGEPIWPIEERVAPQGNVPGEWYSPTQPYPTKPPPYDRNGVSAGDLIDFTPSLRDKALSLTAAYKLGPVFTPPVLSKADGPLATITAGTSGGGAVWGGGSYDPETHILYVHSQTSIRALGLVPTPNPSVSDIKYVEGIATSGARTRGGGSAGGGAEGVVPLTIDGLPLLKPPYGRITAYDMDKGEVLWQVAHGETPDNVRNHPALKDLVIPRTGQPGIIGTFVTKTLLVAGDPAVTTVDGTKDAKLRAYDKATGREVGTVSMPAPQSGSPMTYFLNGKQYIVIAISGSGHPGELLAFRLPDKE